MLKKLGKVGQEIFETPIKYCYDCKNFLPFEKFYKNKRNKDGYGTECKECDNLRKNKWISKNRKRHSEFGYKWYRNNKDKKWASMRRRQEKQHFIHEKIKYTNNGKLYTLSLFASSCFNCSATSSLTIDHHLSLNSGYGLSRKNAVVLCAHCNYSKGTKNPNIFYKGDKLIELIDLGIGDNWLW